MVLCKDRKVEINRKKKSQKVQSIHEILLHNREGSMNKGKRTELLGKWYWGNLLFVWNNNRSMLDTTHTN